MSDEFWDALKAHKKEKFDTDRASFMEKAVSDDDGKWLKHTEWHWSRTVSGKRLDYWPSRKNSNTMGSDPSNIKSTFDNNSCYCDCVNGGPCEHTWDGEPWESEDGRSWSATCSRCGMTAMSHDMRVLP